MGMYYSIHTIPNRYDLDDRFPSDLSWFCERVGASGEDSELKQLEILFGINLDIFNHLVYDWNEDFSLKKSTVSELEEVVEKLSNGINTDPDFYQKINYQDHRPDDCKDYLSSGDFNKDIAELQRIINLYKSEGISEIEFSYN